MFATRSSVLVRTTRVSQEARCALCRASSDETPTRCGPCGVVVHASCGQELSAGLCPTIGCRAVLPGPGEATPEVAAPEAAAPEVAAPRGPSALVALILALGAFALPIDLRLYLALDLVGDVGASPGGPARPIATPARTTPVTPAPEEAPRASPERHWELPVAPRTTGPVPLFSSADPQCPQPDTRWAPSTPQEPSPPARPKRPSWAPSLGD